MTLWPNAGFVLAELGILDEVLELGGTPAAMYRYDAEGSRWAAWISGRWIV